MTALRSPTLLRMALVAAAVLPGCSLRGLSFVRDDRIEIVSPSANATLHMPFEIRWTSDGYDGAYAVFFDRSPIRPGQTLLSLVAESDACRVEPDCPNAEWLADHDVYVTSETTLNIDHLADRRESGRSEGRHDLTIVLLDDQGGRVGESAFTREFRVERGG